MQLLNNLLTWGSCVLFTFQTTGFYYCLVLMFYTLNHIGLFVAYTIMAKILLHKFHLGRVMASSAGDIFSNERPPPSVAQLL